MHLDNDHDSHAKVTLLQYCLIEESAGEMYVLSALGSRFLDLFDENGELAADKAVINEVLFDMIVAWHQQDETFDIHPGLLLLKLLLQPELHYYITDQDVACVFNNTSNTKDTQYADFVKQILEFRDSGVVYSKSELKKTYTLLTGFANNWGVLELEPRSTARVKYVRLTPEFRQLVEQRLGVLTEDRVLNDNEFTELLEDTSEIEKKIAHFEEVYTMREQRKELQKLADEADNIQLREELEEKILRLSRRIKQSWLDLAVAEEDIEEQRHKMIVQLRREAAKGHSCDTIMLVSFEVV